MWATGSHWMDKGGFAFSFSAFCFFALVFFLFSFLCFHRLSFPFFPFWLYLVRPFALAFSDPTGHFALRYTRSFLEDRFPTRRAGCTFCLSRTCGDAQKRVVVAPADGCSRCSKSSRKSRERMVVANGCDKSVTALFGSSGLRPICPVLIPKIAKKS